MGLRIGRQRESNPGRMAMDEIPVVAIVFGVPFAVIAVCRLFKMIEVTSRQYYDHQLKSQMVNRGYSVSEIERLVQMDVKSKSEQDWRPVAASKPQKV
jgi:hypothetical protein